MATTATATSTSRRKKADQRAAELRRNAVHEAGHAIACLAQGIEVAHVWVKNITEDADATILARPDLFDFDADGGVLHKDCGLWESIVIALAGIAGELTAQNLPAEFAFALPEFIEGGCSDFNFAREDARKFIVGRGGEATSEAIFDVIEDGYAAACELLSRHRKFLNR
jgi:hypothetical protein